jgi:tetratricopeptide (TPR) repeat protein
MGDKSAIEVINGAYRGDAECQLELGLSLMLDGRTGGFEWVEKAANQGLASAQNSLGVMYGNGQEVAQNTAKAVEWLQKAANQGHEEARRNLDMLRGHEEEERRAAERRAEEERRAAERKAEEERKAAERRAEEERRAAEKRAEEERKAAEKKAEEERKIAEATEAIKRNPNDAEAYCVRGRLYRAMSDYNRAIADFSKAVNIAPNDAKAYCERGTVYLDDKKDYDRAIADFNQAVSLDPDNAVAYYRRGRAYRAKDDCDKAIEDIGTAAKLDPDNEEYRNQLAKLKEQVRQEAERQRRDKAARRRSVLIGAGIGGGVIFVLNVLPFIIYRISNGGININNDILTVLFGLGGIIVGGIVGSWRGGCLALVIGAVVGAILGVVSATLVFRGIFYVRRSIGLPGVCAVGVIIGAFIGGIRNGKTKRKKIAASIVLAIAVIAATVVPPLIRNLIDSAAYEKEVAYHQRTPQDGTYTFEPRLRAQQSGANGSVDQWLAKVMAQDGNVDLYITSESAGKGARSLSFGPPSTLELFYWAGNGTCTAEKDPVWDEETGAYIITFQNVTSTWFWYREEESDAHDVIIGNIKLTDPDE